MLLAIAIPLAIAAFTLTSTYSESYLRSRIEEMKRLANPEIAKELGVESLIDAIELIRSMNYYPDTFDYTKTPEETIKAGGGDCEDLSVLSYSLLMYLYQTGKIKHKPEIAIAYDDFNPEAHAFVYFYCPRCNEYYIFSNNVVFRSPSVEEAARMLGYSKVIKGEEVS